MNNITNDFGATAIAALLTVVASAAMVLSAIGPAYSSPTSGQQIAAGLANVPGESATSLA